MIKRNIACSRGLILHLIVLPVSPPASYIVRWGGVGVYFFFLLFSLLFHLPLLPYQLLLVSLFLPVSFVFFFSSVSSFSHFRLNIFYLSPFFLFFCYFFFAGTASIHFLFFFSFLLSYLLSPYSLNPLSPPPCFCPHSSKQL